MCYFNLQFVRLCFIVFFINVAANDIGNAGGAIELARDSNIKELSLSIKDDILYCTSFTLDEFCCDEYIVQFNNLNVYEVAQRNRIIFDLVIIFLFLRISTSRKEYCTKKTNNNT